MGCREHRGGEAAQECSCAVTSCRDTGRAGFGNTGINQIEHSDAKMHGLWLRLAARFPLGPQAAASKHQSFERYDANASIWLSVMSFVLACITALSRNVERNASICFLR